MGVTKQAARKRFVPKDGELDASQGFQRFTVRARNVVMASQEEARKAGNVTIQPEHLAVALFSEPRAIAAQALRAQGVKPDKLRKAVAALLPPAAETVPELIPYDSDARKALELTFREALRLGHNYIGTEHLLLALLEAEAGQGPLSSLGVEKSAAEAHLRQALQKA
jgi:ATP-dependent Clp protease ATP-binding subunit ClpA